MSPSTAPSYVEDSNPGSLAPESGILPPSHGASTYMYLVTKEVGVHQNNPENDFVLAYADDIAQTAASNEKLQDKME